MGIGGVLYLEGCGTSLICYIKEVLSIWRMWNVNGIRRCSLFGEYGDYIKRCSLFGRVWNVFDMLY